MRQVWEAVSLPVLVFGREGGSFLLQYQNTAADRLCPPAGTLPEQFADGEFEKLSEVMCSQGADLPAALWPYPLFCHIGEVVYSAVVFHWQSWQVCMLHDVDSFYRETQRKMEEAVMANRAKTSFLSEMSHDIRTPMNAIIGMTDIALMQRENPAQVQSCLEKIRTASNHMMSLLNEVLDMSRIESGRIMLQPEEAEIADLLHEILIVARPQADAKHQEFVLRLGRLDHERIVVDGLRLKQICINLLSNAVKFTPEGGKITLFLELAQDEARPDAVRMHLWVRDTGIGMSKEFLSRVFLPFEREESLVISKIQGTGLGMAITKNLVELMGGQISVESEQGQGTCFSVEVPFAKAEFDEGIYRAALGGKHLLYLDDQEERAETVAAMARRLGMELDWVRRAEQAVHRINDAVFSGLEYFAFLAAESVEGVEMMSFLPEIRKRMGEEFPILMLFESDWKQTEYMFRRSGVDAFVPLPLFYSRFLLGLYSFTEEGRQVQAAEEHRPQKDFTGRRLLLVEDNELNREIAFELLGMSGVEIEEAEDGKQAVEKFRAAKPFYYDIILMDIQMPVMDGLEATRMIRAMDRADAAEIPIIAMTANAFVEDVKASLDAGMDAHLSKPLDIDLVLSCMERFLGRYEG